jgi:hypothetical protein
VNYPLPLKTDDQELFRAFTFGTSTNALPSHASHVSVAKSGVSAALVSVIQPLFVPSSSMPFLPVATSHMLLLL